MKLIVNNQQIRYERKSPSTCFTGISFSRCIYSMCIRSNVRGVCRGTDGFTSTRWVFVDNDGNLQFKGCGNYRLDEYS